MVKGGANVTTLATPGIMYTPRFIAAPRMQDSVVEFLGLDAVFANEATPTASATIPATAFTDTPPSTTPRPTPTPHPSPATATVGQSDPTAQREAPVEMTLSIKDTPLPTVTHLN